MWKLSQKIFLFGIFEKRKRADICLINIVLSHARLAVVLRRNYAHFEGRKIKVKYLFKVNNTKRCGVDL